MNDENVKEGYATHDFFITAYIIASGYELLGVNKNEKNPRRLLFLFEDGEKAQKLANDFIFSRGLIEPKRYAAAIRELKDLIHSQI